MNLSSKSLVPAILLALLAIAVVWALFIKRRADRRRSRAAAFIRSYEFPPTVMAAFETHHPHLTGQERLRALEALRQFFLVRVRAGDRLLSMPSRVVDDLWHEFILDTRDYARFCEAAFGQFFHHVPAVANPPDEYWGAGLRLTWWHVCQVENLNPRGPAQMPLLFAIDTELKIQDGHSFTNWLFAYPRPKGGGSDSGCGGCGSSGDSGHGCGGSGHGCGGGH